MFSGHEIIVHGRKGDATKELAVSRVANFDYGAILASADDRGEAVESQASFVLILSVAGDAVPGEKRLYPGTIKSGGVRARRISRSVFRGGKAEQRSQRRRHELSQMILAL